MDWHPYEDGYWWGLWWGRREHPAFTKAPITELVDWPEGATENQKGIWVRAFRDGKTDAAKTIHVQLHPWGRTSALLGPLVWPS